MQDRDGRLAVVRRLRPQRVVDEGLRIAVVQREQGRLDLHHYPVTGQEGVVLIRQGEAIALRLAGRYRRRMLEAGAITAAEDIHRYRQLIAAEFRLRGVHRRIDVDELDDEV